MGAWEFLDGSADPFFGAVRDLLDDWLSRVQEEHQAALVSQFRAPQDPRAFDSAFWELYLHEAYLRSGYAVEVHPAVPGTARRPDFLFTGHGDRFYLEAVQVGTSTADVAEERRLAAVHDVLDTVQTGQFSLSLSDARIGPGAPATRELRRALTEWLAGLDPDAVVAAVAAPDRLGGTRFEVLPWKVWAADGWELHFHALPLKAEAGPGRAIGMSGPARAAMVDKHTGLTRALDSKANKYGRPPAPLVIAVLDNSERGRTHGYHVEQALYGQSAARPSSAPDLGGLHRDGHWLTRAGWKRGHAPQVISVVGLSPYNVADAQPTLWQTLEPGAVAPKSQPDFLARMDLAPPDPVPLPSGPNPFGLSPGWAGPGPAFD